MTSNINNNNNVNNLVNQIIFPSDMELRKIKKKKKKSNYKKKKAKEDLRDTLKAYDQSIETAKQNNIKLPQQLGTLPTSLPQINSIREMNQLTDDLRQRIVQINELVSSEKEPTPEELRMIRFRKQMGLESESPLKQPQQPQIIPSSIPQQQPPQIIPSVIPQPGTDTNNTI
jgi:predicted  nucleic acid-binding Zn-ribbon protein